MPTRTGSDPPQITDVNLPQLHRLISDPTPWTLNEIRAALGVTNRNTVLKLWRSTANYLYGDLATWPPRGEELKQRLSDDAALERAVWWPPHVSLLPQPDLPHRTRPRWYAGTIRRWAMQVGRMTTDGTAIVPKARGVARPVNEPRADIATVDLVRVHELIADDAQWTIADIREFFDVSESTAQHWYRASRNRRSRGIRSWPPTREESRKISAGDGPGLTWWPPHHRLLPPPVSMDDHGKARFYGQEEKWWGQIRYLWRAGDIKHWGLTTGRLRPDGTVNKEAA